MNTDKKNRITELRKAGIGFQTIISKPLFYLLYTIRVIKRCDFPHSSYQFFPGASVHSDRILHELHIYGEDP